MTSDEKPKVQVFAIVRFDEGMKDVENAISVTEILPSEEEACREAAKLNELNAAKGCRYFVQTTRYYPEGRKRSYGRSEGANK